MALTTFAEIKAAVADWAWTGSNVTAALVGTDFFPQVQSMMYYGDGMDIQALRLRSMVASGTLTPAAGGIISIATDVDAGWLEFIELTPTVTDAVSLSYVEPWQFRKQADLLADAASPQMIYTIEGDNLYVAPKSVTTITAQWYQKFAAVSADGDTDWIITNAPQVYLNGCLMLACAYTQDEREGNFRQKFAAGIKGLNLNDRRERTSGAVKVARPRVVA